MKIKIVKASQKNAWYSEAIGFVFDVYDIGDELLYFVNPAMAIYKFDAIKVSNSEDGEKVSKKKKTRINRN